jgi:hypothetical protein
MNSFNTFHSSLVKSGIIDKVSFNDSLYENIGLYGEIAYNIMDDYYYGNPYWFDNTAYINKTGYITNLDSLQSAVLPLAKLIDNTYTITTLNNNDRFACQWTGYFKSNYTGTWTFYLDTDNWSNLWIGDNAIYGYTKSNRLVTDDYNTNTGTANLSAATINLIQGKYYPIRIQWGEEDGGIAFQFSFSKDGGVTRITDSSTYLYSAKSNLSTLIGMPAVFIKTTPNTVDYLYAPKLFAQYSEKGYHGNDVDYVQNNALFVTQAGVRVSRGPAYIANIGNMNEPSTVLSFTIPTASVVHNYFSILYTGYFKADFTGTFTFNILADDGTFLWIGDYAISGYATTNSVVLNAGDGVTHSGDITLVNGQYYPIRILYGQGTSVGYHTLSFTRNGQTITDWTGYTFHPITPIAGYPRMFTDDIIVIGAHSPIRTYFTNYIINVPTGVSFDTYAGNYAVTSSSIYFTDLFLTYNLFKGDNTLSDNEYSTFWSCGNEGGPSFKPITNTALNYTQSPYNASTGIYVGGGNASLKYSTTYYTRNNETATAEGEWVQIMVPYNMKLTSYSNRARYTNSRIPIQYVILGSTDGLSNWYALDEVAIETYASYAPLKKYTINTTTYPYANNYYNFFRYVIKKTDTPSGGNRIMANENQWNLVGIKEPINPDYVYIGGKNSPINSYFTNYLVNVPTGAGVDKYAGSYEITSSSNLSSNNTFHPYNIFKGSNILSGDEYQPSWGAGGDNSSAFKPITNQALNYTQTPYDANGDYRGGGNASLIYSTIYYTNGTTTATINGEWVQINVPYNMQLLSYSARSRFTNFRLPVQYAILGSNDGSTWYALDVVDIGSWDKYIPLKKFTINNTTTYSYAKNYYSYFRYVIKKVDSSPSARVTDKLYAHENQWNLVGIKETPNANVGKPIYIGANSPTGFTSYFTSNSVTIPSNFVSPEYVGIYAITESSTSGNPSNTYNLFLNDSINDGQSYYKIWHSGYTGTNTAYINGSLVTYSQQPYVAATGVYQGGNTTTYKFGTSYYRTATSTYYTAGNAFLGEWVQIKLPFRMKLTGYSNRTRYLDYNTLGRNPDYITIFGSNDGVIWYVVITSSNTVPLNVVNVDTTSYPDGIHGYSYFRWVINSLDKGDVANENQWNLIGVRTT